MTTVDLISWTSGDDESEPETRTSILDILNSKVLVALVTVAVGGMFTTCVADILQRGAKERELKNTWLQDRAKHRLQAQRTFLDEQRTAVELSFKTIGRVRAASFGLLDTGSELFADEKFKKGDDQKLTEKQRQDLRTEYNTADDEWHRSRAMLGYLLADYPATDKTVPTAWDATEAAVGALQKCAEHEYVKWFLDPGGSSPGRCANEDDALMKAWGDLSTALRNSRNRARWEWENATVLQDLIVAPTRP